jgi:hypothetical protein
VDVGFPARREQVVDGLERGVGMDDVLEDREGHYTIEPP